jgi:hypothetical protein
MLGKLVGAGSLLLLCIGITFADEIRAVITKVEGDRVTFAEAKGKGQKGRERTLPVADNVRVVKGKMNRDTRKLESGDAISDGLKNKVFAEIGEKGVPCLIVTDNDNKKITEIRVSGGRGKGKRDR